MQASESVSLATAIAFAPEGPLMVVGARDYNRIADFFESMQATARSKDCAVLWARLRPLTRCTWCHAACIPGEECLSDWSALSLEEQTALFVALENMKDFFSEAGA